MNTLLVLAIVAVFVAAVYVVFRDRGIWKEYYAAPAHHPDEALSIFSQLSRAGIRCRIQSMGDMRGSAASGAGTTIYVLVHRQDMEKAHQTVPLEGEKVKREDEEEEPGGR
jgi:hypothetical protein